MNFKSHSVAEFILLSFYEAAFDPEKTSYELNQNLLTVSDSEKGEIFFSFERKINDDCEGATYVIGDDANNFYKIHNGKWKVASVGGMDRIPNEKLMKE